VRSGCYRPGADFGDPEEYEILLATGGSRRPHRLPIRRSCRTLRGPLSIRTGFGGSRPYYAAGPDRIQMPPIEAFRDG